jgi:hypothetical protein
MTTQWAQGFNWAKGADRQVGSTSPDQADQDTDAGWLGSDGWVSRMLDSAKSPGAEGRP